MTANWWYHIGATRFAARDGIQYAHVTIGQDKHRLRDRRPGYHNTSRNMRVPDDKFCNYEINHNTSNISYVFL
jgi:hypothetical protein